MAGTLTISTLSDGTNSTSSTNCIKGSAKAWVNFNGSGGASIRASFNVSSVTRNGTGDYTVNFSNALADANYSVFVTGTNGSAAAIGSVLASGGAGTSPATMTASAIRIGYWGTDMNVATIGVFR